MTGTRELSFKSSNAPFLKTVFLDPGICPAHAHQAGRFTFLTSADSVQSQELIAGRLSRTHVVEPVGVVEPGGMNVVLSVLGGAAAVEFKRHFDKDK